MAANVEVVIVGVSNQAQSCGCGSSCGPMDCGSAGTLQDVVEQLAKTLAKTHGPTVTVRLVDVFSREMDEFPVVDKLIQAGRVRLPVTSVNGQPRFQGGVSAPLISKAVAEVLEAESLGPV